MAKPTHEEVNEYIDKIKDKIALMTSDEEIRKEAYDIVCNAVFFGIGIGTRSVK